MFLVVVNESNFGLELFSTLLVPELANVSTSLLGLSSVPRLHSHSAVTECPIPALRGDEGGVFVPNQFSNEADSGIRILSSPW